MYIYMYIHILYIYIYVCFYLCLLFLRSWGRRFEFQHAQCATGDRLFLFLERSSRSRGERTWASTRATAERGSLLQPSELQPLPLDKNSAAARNFEDHCQGSEWAESLDVLPYGLVVGGAAGHHQYGEADCRSYWADRRLTESTLTRQSFFRTEIHVLTCQLLNLSAYLLPTHLHKYLLRQVSQDLAAKIAVQLPWPLGCSRESSRLDPYWRPPRSKIPASWPAVLTV